jgi:uncharacterized protein
MIRLVADQKPEKIVVKTSRGCNPSCCGCHCALPALLVPAFAISAWLQGFVTRDDLAPPLKEAFLVDDTSGHLSRLAIRFIGSYRGRVSGRLGIQCRFEPSCSAYALEAYCRYGFVKATRASLYRILRCNPLNHSPAVDPLRPRRPPSPRQA